MVFVVIGQFGSHLICAVHSFAPVCIQGIASVQRLIGEILRDGIGSKRVQEQGIIEEGEVVVGPAMLLERTMRLSWLRMLRSENSPSHQCAENGTAWLDCRASRDQRRPCHEAGGTGQIAMA